MPLLFLLYPHRGVSSSCNKKAVVLSSPVPRIYEDDRVPEHRKANSSVNTLFARSMFRNSFPSQDHSDTFLTLFDISWHNFLPKRVELLPLSPQFCRCQFKIMFQGDSYLLVTHELLQWVHISTVLNQHGAVCISHHVCINISSYPTSPGPVFQYSVRIVWCYLPAMVIYEQPVLRIRFPSRLLKHH